MRIRYGYGLKFAGRCGSGGGAENGGKDEKRQPAHSLPAAGHAAAGIYTNLTKEEILPLALAVKKYTISDTTGCPFRTM